MLLAPAPHWVPLVCGKGTCWLSLSKDLGQLEAPSSLLVSHTPFRGSCFPTSAAGHHPSGVTGAVATQQFLLSYFECSEGHTLFSAFAKMSIQVRTRVVLTIQTQDPSTLQHVMT